MVKMTEQEFIKELKKLNITLTQTQINQFQIYADFLQKYNKHTNLTAIKNLEDIYLKHFYDSLTLTKIINLDQGKLLDIGTGAGFPGLVLAITYPNLQVTLLDSNNKKITFLKECLKLLKISNVTIVADRAENYTRTHREEYDYVTSRAVAQLRILIELGIPSLKINQYLIAMKSHSKDEVADSQIALQKLNCQIVDQINFDLPKNAGYRTLIKIIKNQETPSIYPRTYDKIKKKI